MALDALRCNHLVPLGFKGLKQLQNVRRHIHTKWQQCLATQSKILCSSMCWSYQWLWQAGCSAGMTSICNDAQPAPISVVITTQQRRTAQHYWLHKSSSRTPISHAGARHYC